jgi:HEAT repeat protein
MKPKVYRRKLFWTSTLLILGGLGMALLNPHMRPNGNLSQLQQVAKPKPANDFPPSVKFTDTTLAMGIQLVHEQGEDQLSGIDESLGSGACAFDYDGDGWTDLFLVNGSGHTHYYGKHYWWQDTTRPALLRNMGGKRFENVTKPAGLNRENWGMGCLSADFDNDGDPDLFLTNLGGNQLYRNEGNGRFTDIAKESGIVGDYWSTSASAADINGDGLLDIYVGNYINFKKGAKTFESGSQFTPEKPPTFDASLYDAQPNQLYLNLGGLKFREMASEAGVAVADGRTLDVHSQDINADGKPDLLVTNDRGTGSNLALLNHDGIHFQASGSAFRLQTPRGSRGIASGDIDNNGDDDLILANPPGESLALLIRGNTTSLQTTTPASSPIQFADLSRKLGVGNSEYTNLSGWTPGVQDFNNDGSLDLFLASGHLEPDPDTHRVSEGQHKQLWLNRGDGSFVDATATAGKPLMDNQSARGAVFADFDNDGDMDTYVAHNNDLGQFLRNDTPSSRHWLELRLTGKASNRDGIGAKVEIQTASGNQTRTVVSGAGFLSDGDKRLHFGLGESSLVDRLEILWPNGEHQVFNDIAADRYISASQGSDNLVSLTMKNTNDSSLGNIPFGLSKASAAIQARYLRLLVDAKGFSASIPQLRTALLDKDATIRRVVIDLAASQKKSPEGLPLLVTALEDGDPVNVVAAIDALRVYEEELSVRFLLRGFTHPNESVRIATANAFGFFFQEEEAVVHRKYLALPELSRLLDDPAPAAQIAAANALAQAERYRGIHELEAHLDDSSIEVRASVVRTLGLLRQREAIPALQKLLENGNQSPVVCANALVALKRLNMDGINELTEKFIKGIGEFAHTPKPNRLQVADLLVAEPEASMVIDVAAIRELMRKTFKSEIAGRLKEVQPNSQRNDFFHKSNGKDVKRLMAMIENTNTPSLDREATLLELANTDSESVPIPKTLLSDLDPRVRKAAVQVIIRQHKGVMEEEEARLIRRACADPTLAVRGRCVDSLSGANQPWAQDILALIVGDPKYPKDVRLMVLDKLDVVVDPEMRKALFLDASNAGDPLRPELIRKLFDTADSDIFIDFAGKLTRDLNENFAVRLTAVEYLVKRKHNEAFDLLLSTNAKASEISPLPSSTTPIWQAGEGGKTHESP